MHIFLHYRLFCRIFSAYTDRFIFMGFIFPVIHNFNLILTSSHSIFPHFAFLYQPLFTNVKMQIKKINGWSKSEVSYTCPISHLYFLTQNYLRLTVFLWELKWRFPGRLSCKANFSRFVLQSWDKAQSADTPSNNNNNKTKKPKPEDSS